jgi:hypothetical protein
LNIRGLYLSWTFGAWLLAQVGRIPINRVSSRNFVDPRSVTFNHPVASVHRRQYNP